MPALTLAGIRDMHTIIYLEITLYNLELIQCAIYYLTPSTERYLAESIVLYAVLATKSSSDRQ